MDKSKASAMLALGAATLLAGMPGMRSFHEMKAEFDQMAGPGRRGGRRHNSRSMYAGFNFSTGSNRRRQS